MKRFFPISMLVLISAMAPCFGMVPDIGMDLPARPSQPGAGGLQLRFVTVPDAVTIPPAPRPNDPPKPKQPNLQPT